MSADPARMKALDDNLLDAIVSHAQATRDTLRAMSDELDSLHAELAEVRDELVTHEQRHRRDIDALRESIRATDRVLADRTSHLV